MVYQFKEFQQIVDAVCRLIVVESGPFARGGTWGGYGPPLGEFMS